MEKTRKQHFVPQFYLRNFAIQESQCKQDKKKCRIYVYDKRNRNTHPALIRDIAQQNYFYDFAPDNFAVKRFATEDPQVVEHKLCELEGSWATQLDDFLSHAGTEPIQEVEMNFLATFLTFQIIRTSEFRALLEEADALTVPQARQQYLAEGYSPDIVQAMLDYFNQRPALVQASLLLNADKVATVANMLLNHIWVVGINNNSQLLYTSDHPVVRKAHLPDPSMGGGGGIASRGIEISFPLSPNVLLMLFDRTAFYKIMYLDKTIIPLTSEFVDIYNARQVMQSHRHIFSQSENFSFASQICQKQPAICQPDRRRVRIDKVSL